MSSELSIIIVNWNGGELLKRCLKSIADAPPSGAYDIVLVDNASSDDSVAWLRSGAVEALLPGVPVHIVENSDNEGFSKANNQGIAHSNAPMLLMLNPDTEVTAGAIDTLVACLNSDERIGACGPRLLNSDGSLQYSVWRNPPTAWEIVGTGLPFWRLIPNGLRGPLFLGRHWDHSTRREVPVLFGAAILVRRKTMEKVGRFDESFHMYCEDYEWCLRARRGGWQLIFEPAASVTHHGGHSAQQRWSNPDILRTQLEAFFQYQRSSVSRSHSISYLLATCFVSFIHKSWFRVRGRSAEIPQIMWELHLADLKRTLRGG